MHKAAAHAKRGLPLRHLPAMDLPFLVLVLTLVGFGLVMLGSASGAVALYRRGDAFAYLRPQLLYAAMGIAGLWLASRVDYHIFHKLAWPLLGVSLVLLVVVLFMPEYNGCKRWLVLPGVGTLQPSEIAKFAVVLVFSHIISLNHDRMRSFAVGVLPFALVLGVVAALMLLEPHLSGTLLILGIGAVLMFVGGTGLRWFVLAGVGGAAAIGAAVVVMPDLVPYAADRLREAGAREVYWLPVYCKKGRPGWQLQVICAHEDIERLQTIIFLETTTNGIRRQVMERVCLPRRFEQVTTPWGEVSVKVATLPDGSERAAPEYEDCARLAREHGVPLQRVMQTAQAAALQFE